MNRNQLVTEALQASKHARHNLALIQRQPDRIAHGKHADAVTYLQMMIRFAANETAATKSPRIRFLDRLRGVMRMQIKSS